MISAEVVAIGDELTSGERLDTNSQWISQRLGELGVHVHFHSTAADRLEGCADVFQAAIARADIVIATGGLGPTADDLTRDAIAVATNCPLELDAESLKHIEALFRLRKREMPVRNRVQAMFPRGSHPINNPHGSAPGIAMKLEGPGQAPCHLFALPGVPAEMHEMWRQTVAPCVSLLSGGGRVIRHRRIKCFGAGESHVEQMLPDVIARDRHPSVGITVHQGTITLRITADGATEEECHAAIEPTAAIIHECLGKLVFGAEDDELENALGRLLAKNRETLATVEWGSAGLIAHWLSSAEECHDRYLGGEIIASPRAAAGLLGLPPAGALPGPENSQAMAEHLAMAIRKRTGASLGLATSRIASIAEMKEANQKFVVALAWSHGVECREFSAAAHPAIVHPLAAKRAIDFARRWLIDPRDY